ncbi:Dihydroanticapsin 7-dehydrogenase [Acaryochloris thomasi RCC1774]|uniref:Dihydroanticapsin 7-dehydrogenase n=1 Tax=Acaryochloris thomasi RCC1774 TaxID=1764569 RepID=A0A2W1JLN9_9CYAN|nr:3-oxoacyl-ACP reductase FabG [Acaryochloris thomasi]PZD74300.1 Dihydroanticapsin 7-dehydrogenase [Acaryochloris thomasi RCC1774]
MQTQHVLITGGTGGLGLGVTPQILMAGAEVTIPFINESEVNRLRERLSAAELARTHFVKADLMQESSVAELVMGMQRVDVLIHLVGGFAMGPTHEFSEQDWIQMLDLNLRTAFLLCKHSLKRMRQHGYGRIVTVGSQGAVQPGGQLAAYCAAKAGVVALTQSIADETRGTNITANVVLPSIIDTPSNREAMGTEQVDQWVKPESLGQVIGFLASEAAQDIRGAAVPVYGSL